MCDEKHFVAAIPSSGVEVLTSLIGRTIGEVWSSSFTVYPEYILAPDFAMHSGEREWIIIDNEWDETPKEFLDFHLLSVAAGATPKNIDVGRSKTQSIRSPASSVWLGQASPIDRILILQQRVAGDVQECVEYDRCIVFDCADGSRFLIGATEGISGLLEFTQDGSKIDELLASLSIRLSIE